MPGWRTSGPRLASPLSTAPSSRGLRARRRCALACGRAALLPAGDHRDIHAPPHVAAQRPSFLRLADVVFVRHDAYHGPLRPPYDGPLTTARSMARPPPPGGDALALVGALARSCGPLPRELPITRVGFSAGASLSGENLLDT